MSELNILAVDVGFGNTKAVWGADPASEICFKSLTPSTSIDPNAFSGTSLLPLDRIQIQVAGNVYFVGPDAYMAGGSYHLDPDYIKRQEYLALLRGAIFYMFKNTGRVVRELDALVLGLPVSSFAKLKDQLTKVARFEHPVPVPMAYSLEFGDNIMVTAKKVLVLPQPMGALRHSGGLSGSAANSMFGANTVNLVIDPGYNTFDWLVSSGFQPDLARSGSFQGGVAQILREVSGVAGMKLGVGQIDLVECEIALETGELRANGKKIPFQEFAQVAQRAAAEVVDRFVGALDMRRRFDNIIMTGGGAKFYEHALRKRFPDYNIVVHADSVMTNARGFRMMASDMLP